MGIALIFFGLSLSVSIRYLISPLSSRRRQCLLITSASKPTLVAPFSTTPRQCRVHKLTFSPQERGQEAAFRC